MKDFAYELLEGDLEVIRNFYNSHYDLNKPKKILFSGKPPLSDKEFIDGMCQRIAFEWRGPHPIEDSKLKKRFNESKDCFEFQINGNWKTFIHPINQHINRETHFYIERVTKENGFRGYFNKLPLSYEIYRERTCKALVIRAIEFYNNEETFFPAKPSGEDLANLRKSLEKYF